MMGKASEGGTVSDGASERIGGGLDGEAEWMLAHVEGVAVEKAFNPDQQRQADGEFGSGGGQAKDKKPPGAKRFTAAEHEAALGDDSAYRSAFKLSKEQKAAVKEYQKGDYQRVNAAAASGKEDATVDALRDLIGRHEAAEPLQLTRGISAVPRDSTLPLVERQRAHTQAMADFARLRTGQVIPIARGFASTSSRSGIRFGEIRFHVTVPEGGHAFPMPKFRAEDETLLHDGARFRIDRVELGEEADYGHGRVPRGIDFHVTMVHDGIAELGA